MGERIQDKLDKVQYAVGTTILAPGILMERVSSVGKWGGNLITDRLKKMGFLRGPYMPAETSADVLELEMAGRPKTRRFNREGETPTGRSRRLEAEVTSLADRRTED